MSPNFLILILGGTPEAHDLTLKLQTEVKCLYSLAGRAPTRRPPPEPHRIGGFGGIDGLVRFLRETGVTHLVDATHPFAARISHNAWKACQLTEIPRIVYQRPAWEETPGDRWIRVPDGAAAVHALPKDSENPFLALGRADAEAFAPLAREGGPRFTARVIGGDPPFPGCALVRAQGPFTETEERALLRDRGIDCLICKNSGGQSGRAKLDAARSLGIPVVMIDRPAPEPGPVVADFTSVFQWIHDPGPTSGLKT